MSSPVSIQPLKCTTATTARNVQMPANQEVHNGRTWKHFKMDIIEFFSQFFDLISGSHFQLSNQAKLDSLRNSTVRLVSSESLYQLGSENLIVPPSWQKIAPAWQKLAPAWESINSSQVILKKMKQESVSDPKQMAELVQLEMSFDYQQKNIKKFIILSEKEFDLQYTKRELSIQCWGLIKELKVVSQEILNQFGNEIADSGFVNAQLQSFLNLTEKQVRTFAPRALIAKEKAVIEEMILSLEKASVAVPSKLQEKIMSVRNKIEKVENMIKTLTDEQFYQPVLDKSRALEKENLKKASTKKTSAMGTSSRYAEVKAKLENKLKFYSPNHSEAGKIRYELVDMLSILIKGIKGYSKESSTFWKCNEDKEMIEFVNKSFSVIFPLIDRSDMLNSSKFSNEELLLFAKKVYALLVKNKDTFPIEARNEPNIGWALKNIEEQISLMESYLSTISLVKTMRSDISDQTIENKLRSKLQRSVNKIKQSQILMENLKYKSKTERFKTLLHIPYQPKHQSIIKLLETDLRKLNFKQLKECQNVFEKEMVAIYLDVFAEIPKDLFT